MNDANNAGTLAPCPFCDTAMPRQVCRHDEHGRPSYSFQCVGSECGICGPEAGDIEEAARRWNNRHWGSAPDEDDTLVHQVARSIAEHGVGRPWDDFKPVDAYDLGQSDLIEYARAAIAALPTRALSTPNAPVEQREATIEAIRAYCQKVSPGSVHSSSTDGDRIYYAGLSIPELVDAILAVRLDEAAIRKDEREKCAEDNSVRCLFCRRSIAEDEDAVVDVNGEIACKACGDAEFQTQRDEK